MPNSSGGAYGIHQASEHDATLYPANRISGVTCDPNMRFVALMASSIMPESRRRHVRAHQSDGTGDPDSGKSVAYDRLRTNA